MLCYKFKCLMPCARQKWRRIKYNILYGNFVSTDTIVKLYCLHHYRKSYMNYIDEDFYIMNTIQAIFFTREICIASLSTWNQLPQMVEVSSVLCSKSYDMPRTVIRTQYMISWHVLWMWLDHCHTVLTCHSYSILFDSTPPSLTRRENRQWNYQ
jgi:hypothetical protein